MSKWSRYADDIRFAITDMQANPLRTSLSLLGVTIGIFSIIMVRTIIDSLNANVSNTLSTLGSDVVYVSKFAWVPEDTDSEYPFWKYMARPSATYSEYKMLRSELQNIDALAIFYGGVTQNISLKGQSLKSLAVYGVTNDFNRIQDINVEKGRYFTENESESISPVAVLGSEVAEKLAPGRDVTGEYLNLDNNSLRIIGVLESKGENMAGFDFDNAVLISFKLANQIYRFESNTINSRSDPLLMVKANDPKLLPEVEDNITGVLRRMRQLSPKEENNFSYNRLSTLQKTVDAIFFSINLGGLLIGAFAMIIGIFGIANIMFVAVNERTPQIGLLKALGAKKIDILIEFISESIILCLIGGFMGLVLIYILSLIISQYSSFEVFLSWNNFFVGMLVSLIAGFLAGIIPANRAANMKPVDAIRYS